MIYGFMILYKDIYDMNLISKFCTSILFDKMFIGFVWRYSVCVWEGGGCIVLVDVVEGLGI